MLASRACCASSSPLKRAFKADGRQVGILWRCAGSPGRSTAARSCGSSAAARCRFRASLAWAAILLRRWLRPHSSALSSCGSYMGQRQLREKCGRQDRRRAAGHAAGDKNDQVLPEKKGRADSSIRIVPANSNFSLLRVPHRQIIERNRRTALANSSSNTRHRARVVAVLRAGDHFDAAIWTYTRTNGRLVTRKYCSILFGHRI